MNKTELLLKIKQLADKGIAGEKDNAEIILNKLLKKYNISLEDLEQEQEKDFLINLDKFSVKLFSQITALVAPEAKMYGEFPKKDIKALKLEGNYSIKCTNVQFIEIKSKFDFYLSLYQKEVELFYFSFLYKNDLLTKGRSENKQQLSVEQQMKILQLSKGIKKGIFNKQLKQA